MNDLGVTVNEFSVSLVPLGEFGVSRTQSKPLQRNVDKIGGTLSEITLRELTPMENK
jgi:hypothetical protein